MDDELKALLTTLIDKADKGFAELAEVKAEQRRLADAQLRTEGQLSVMLAWLQSMDQRFGALMAPVTPPRKPAA